MIKLSELIIYVALFIYFTDGASTLIEIIHGPQPKTEAPVKAPSESKSSGDLKPTW